MQNMTRKKHHENIVMFFCQKDVIFAINHLFWMAYNILVSWIDWFRSGDRG